MSKISKSAISQLSRNLMFALMYHGDKLDRQTILRAYNDIEFAYQYWLGLLFTTLDAGKEAITDSVIASLPEEDLIDAKALASRLLVNNIYYASFIGEAFSPNVLNLGLSLLNTSPRRISITEEEKVTIEQLTDIITYFNANRNRIGFNHKKPTDSFDAFCAHYSHDVTLFLK